MDSLQYISHTLNQNTNLKEGKGTPALAVHFNPITLAGLS